MISTWSTATKQQSANSITNKPTCVIRGLLSYYQGFIRVLELTQTERLDEILLHKNWLRTRPFRIFNQILVSVDLRSNYVDYLGREGDGGTAYKQMMNAVNDDQRPSRLFSAARA